jgi:quinohemoprotein amine dehydrogenase
MSISAPASRSRASSARRPTSRPFQSTVAATAALGARDLFVAGASRQKALCGLRQDRHHQGEARWAMARVGGVTFPKMLAQFEAWGYSNGADGKPDSPDDIELGIVDAAWSMEEYTATYNDDDIKFVGTLNEATGRFTPNFEGPNPARSGQRNNVGDVVGRREGAG